MSFWMRVFGTREQCPSATELMHVCLHQGVEVQSEVLGDDRDWEQVTLRLPGAAEGVMVERVGGGELGAEEVREEIRPVVESFEGREGPGIAEVLDRIRNSQQLFIIGLPAATPQRSPLRRLAAALASHLARSTEGIYQIPDKGFFNPDGELLVPDQEDVG